MKLIHEAAEGLVLHDVSLSDHAIKLGSVFDPINDYGESTLNITYGPREGSLSTLQTSEGRTMKRWAVRYGAHIRILKGEFQEVDPNSISPDTVLAEIDATFFVQFLLKDGVEVSQAGLDEFTQYNVVHLIWPYIREFLHSICARTRLPPITLHVSIPSNSKAEGEKPQRTQDPSAGHQAKPKKKGREDGIFA